MHRRSFPTALRHPSPAVVISLIALFFAMSGTAVAATGGDFILGKSNSASSLTVLSNSNGSALDLSSTSNKPSLIVSNGVQVPRLNASFLGGNSPNAYMHGDGQVSHSSTTFDFGHANAVGLPGTGAVYELFCNSSGTAQSILTVLNANSQVWWLNKDGDGYSALGVDQTADLTPASADPYTIEVQLMWGSNVVTLDVSQAVNPVTQTCTYAVQSVSDG